MPSKTQAQFRITAKTAALRKGLTLQAIANKIGCSRQAVSLAINHGKCAGIKAKVESTLGL